MFGKYSSKRSQNTAKTRPLVSTCPRIRPTLARSSSPLFSSSCCRPSNLSLASAVTMSCSLMMRSLARTLSLTGTTEALARSRLDSVSARLGTTVGRKNLFSNLTKRRSAAAELGSGFSDTRSARYWARVVMLSRRIRTSSSPRRRKTSD